MPKNPYLHPDDVKRSSLYVKVTEKQKNDILKICARKNNMSQSEFMRTYVRMAILDNQHLLNNND